MFSWRSKKILSGVIAALSFATIVPVASAGTGEVAFATGIQPIISSISPSTITEVGGHTFNKTITITGQFLALGNETPRVVLNGVVQPNPVTVVSGTKITFDAPSGSGTVGVALGNFAGTTTAGTTVGKSALKYAAPKVTSISPTSGPDMGSTTVKLKGTGLDLVNAVTIGGVAVTSKTVVSDTEVDVVTPAGSGTKKAIQIATSVGDPLTTQTPTFTYNPPKVTTSDVKSGPDMGSTAVKLKGTNLDSIVKSSVTVGGVSVGASNVTLVSGTEVDIVTPAGSGANKVIAMSDAQGVTATVTPKFTYNAPKVTAMDVKTGPDAGSTAVKLTGTNLSDIVKSSVKVNGNTVGASNVTLVSATEVDIKTPAGSGTNRAITMSDAEGVSATVTPKFGYLPPQTTATLSVNHGLEAATTSVTVTSTNGTLGDIVSAKVNGTSAVSASSTDSNHATIVVQSGVGLSKTITVTDNEGVTSTLTAKWSWDAPKITSLSSSSGTNTATTTVTITGTNLSQVTHVVLTAGTATPSSTSIVPNSASSTSVAFTMPTATVTGKSGTVKVSVNDGVTGSTNPVGLTYTYK